MLKNVTFKAAAVQVPTGAQAVTPAQLQAAFDNLGKLDSAVRANASRIVRRAPAAQAVPALLQTVAEHADGYVRYRALVLLTAFNDPRTRDSMREALASPNDRLRAVAYSFFEHNPDRALLPQFLTALDKEQGQFVRPSLVRALAALAVPAGEESVRGFLSKRRHRGARRLQGRVRGRRNFRHLQARWTVAGRRGARAWQDWGAAGAGNARRPSADGSPSDAAVGRRGNLPAGRQLRVARGLPD